MHIRTRMGWPCTGERLISAILRTSPPPKCCSLGLSVQELFLDDRNRNR
jgi:hypothetical protein